ncbi:MAG: HAD-IIIA family hydrolase [Synergistaceae bacterium]|nr:HAD-IIIA family hydrolase [Synergistaceae bacterium]
MKTVINAGGKGTRISSLFAGIPKPMIDIAGKPVLEREIECLKSQGFDDLIITVSHLAGKIMDYFGDGKDFGVKIEYFTEPEPLGTAGALFILRDKLTEPFLLLNGDIMFDVDLKRFADYHAKKGGLATLFTHPNNHPYDGCVIAADENNAATHYFPKEEPRPQWYRNRVNAGLHMLSPEVLDTAARSSRKVDLDREILRPLCGTGKMFCYDSPEYVRDMGTPERYREVCSDFLSGKIQARSLRSKQKAVFLDRDGTINNYVGFLKDIDEFELLPGAAEAVRKINASGYLAIVVTNQPVIARGEVTREELGEIHNKMETLLGKEGAYLDAIYYCPHHPDKGYDGEVPELKIDCSCRKPKPGMLIKAAIDLNIDLSSSWMIGDGENDIEAGKSAGCRTALIGSGAYGQDMTAESLLDFTERVSLSLTPLRGIEPKILKHIDRLTERYPILEQCRKSIIEAYTIMEESYENGGKLLIAGNGGSAADSGRMAGELMKRFLLPRPVPEEFAHRLRETDPELGADLAGKLERGLAAIPLVTHEALSTEYMFAQQVYGFGRNGDVFLGITTSGSSRGVILAAVTARALGMKVVALTSISAGGGGYVVMLMQ